MSTARLVLFGPLQMPSGEVEEQAGEEGQGDARRGHHERPAVVSLGLDVRAVYAPVLEDVATDVHQLFPQHKQHNQEQEETGCKLERKEKEREHESWIVKINN